jgi:hypothetical protein
MIYLILGLVLLIFLFGAYLLHIFYLREVHAKIEALKNKIHVPDEDFYENMTVAQGSNFIGLANAAGMMLFVAIAYFYLLIPGRLPISFMMQMPDLASSQFGFFIFGIMAALLAAAVILISDMLPESHRNLKLTEVYSFYSVSKGMKRNIGLVIPALCVSIVLSAYNGTIYPENNNIFDALSLTIVFASAAVLVWPVLVGRK